MAESRVPVYAFAANGNGDRLFRATLSDRNIGYRRVRAGRYVIYLTSKPVLPDEVPALRAAFGLE